MNVAAALEPAALPFPDYPANGTATEVAPGIFWLSTPVPFVALKQVNCWLLRDGDGWTMIDCGYGRTEVRDAFETAWRAVLGTRPLTRLIVTHHHPDHAGNMGWIAERWGGLRPVMTRNEWLTANLSMLNRHTDHVGRRAAFYRAHGLGEERLAQFQSEVVPYDRGVRLAPSYRRLRDGDTVEIGGERWLAVTGEGHSPEHISLYCAERKVLIAGDQILPGITTNVSTWPTEPESDAVGAYLSSCRRFLDLLDADTLVLPSHRRPFFDVHGRLRELARHHAARLNLLLDNVGTETDAGGLIDVLFRAGLDGHQIGFAMGEAIAHLNHLVTLGRLERVEQAGRIRYRPIDRAPVPPAFA